MRVFVSYAESERSFVLRLISDLEDALPEIAFHGEETLDSAATWVSALTRQVEVADVFLAVLSPDYLESHWTKYEAYLGLDRFYRASTRLIPLLVRICPQLDLFGSLTIIDFTGDYEQALTRLLWGITGVQPGKAVGKEPGVLSEHVASEQVTKHKQQIRAEVERLRSRECLAGNTHGPKPAADEATSTCPYCFVIMPFGQESLQEIYEDIVKPTLEKYGLKVVRGDDPCGSNVVMADVVKYISTARIVVADLTRLNPNVHYEVGIAHTLERTVLLLAQSETVLPFDLQHRRVLRYNCSPDGAKALEKELERHLTELLA